MFYLDRIIISETTYIFASRKIPKKVLWKKVISLIELMQRLKINVKKVKSKCRNINSKAIYHGIG